MIRTAKTENGWVRGIEAADPRITAFKGVPFAAPPVGENRWRAPQPCEDWEGVRDASRFAPIGMQAIPGLGDDIYCREWHVDPDQPMSEDCLYLNIWTGAGTAEERLPVLVWFFGGAFQCGYPSEMEFDGERLARRGVVVVTVNYRVNVFGFLAHPQLTREQPEAPTNFGTLDQQAALRWVSRNIAAFGGDPDCVTIAGQSAGGGSVLSQMACRENEGLFRRAVIMSAMIRSPYRERSIGEPAPLWRAEENGWRFLDFLGVKSLEEARALDAVFIRDKYEEFVKQCPPMAMATVVDHRFCVGDPLVLFLQGRCLPVEVMAGNTGDEFPNHLEAADEKELAERAVLTFGPEAEEFLRFPQAHVPDGKGGFGTVNGIEYTVKTLLSRREAEGKGPAGYYYRFEPDMPGQDHPGTFHSSDLWFFFETLAKCWRPFTGRHYDLARQMCGYWCNFIKTGDPNGPDADGTLLPRWETYTCENPCQMRFTSRGACPDREEKTDWNAFLKREIETLLSVPDAFREEWLKPVWESGEQFRETFAMVEEEGCCEASFLYEPGQVLRVESYDGSRLYEAGRDYEVRGDKLVLTENSRIPRMPGEELLYPTRQKAQEALDKGMPLTFGPLETTDGRFLNLDAIGHPEVITSRQLAVTYTTGECWKGFRPVSAMDRLPALKRRLAAGEPVRVLLYGDSISCGFDCSGMYGQKPGQPIWLELLKHRMEERWDSPVSVCNTSVGGVDTRWAIEQVPERVAPFHPDLVLLGFGMNDRCPGEEYRALTERLLEAVQKAAPGCECVLIATSLPNELAATAPFHFWAHQDEYADSLRPLCKEGVVLADVQEVQRELQKKKRYVDLTGNWLNHPNDYLARVQAQVLAAVLGLYE